MAAAPAPDEPPAGPDPTRSHDPYSAPRADIMLTPVEHANQSPSTGEKLAMGFGIVLCGGWPALFGMMLSSNAGCGGILLALLLVAAPVLWLCWSQRTIYAALGTGLLILGLLSVIPTLPMLLGTALIQTVTGQDIKQFTGGHSGQGRLLSFWESARVTALFAACYIIPAGALGGIIQSARHRTRRRTDRD